MATLHLILLLCLLTIFGLLDQINTHPTADPHTAQEEIEIRDGSGHKFSKRQNINQYYTYTIDANSATQAANVQAKQQAGYRIISLSVYGDPTHPLYSTVWSNRPTAPTYITHFTNDTESFADWAGNEIAMGWTASLVSVTGPPSNPQFAAVLEKRSDVAASQLHYDMTDGDADTVGSFAWYNQQAYSQNMVLKCMSIYGGPTSRRWAAVWQSNPNVIRSRYHFGDAVSDYAQTVTTETSMPGFRPAHVSLDTDQWYSSLWTNDRLSSSTQWQYKYGLTHTALLQAIQTASSSGLAPISVAGGGSTSNANIVYSVILAPTDVIDTRIMKAPVGSIESTYFENPTAAAQSIHDLIQGYMYQYKVRYAQVSIKKGGQPRMDWAYSYTELNNCSPFKCSVSPSDKFLLASNSKTFLAAAVNVLITQGKLSLNTLVFQELGFGENLNVKGLYLKDTRYLQITVEQCLLHQGGWNSTQSGFDPVFNMGQIALDEGSTGQPATTSQIVSYMASTYVLDFNPGAGTQYSNFGYLVLSDLVAQITGMSYYQFLYNQVLTPSGVNLSQISDWQTAEANRPAGEITQESSLAGPSALTPTSTIAVPDVYGGDGLIKEVSTGTTDLTCSMDVLSKFISQNNVYGWGPRAPGAREGSIWGAWTWSQTLPDGVDWALAFNTRDWVNAQYTDNSGSNDATPQNFAASLNLAIVDLDIA